MQRITGFNANTAPLGKRKGAHSDNQPSAKRERWTGSRWGGPTEKSVFPGLPLVLPKGLSKGQLDAYTMRVRIEEISLRIRTDQGPPRDRPRSPSPEPIYGTDGKRVNLREQRYRKRLEDERHKLINICSATLQGFQSPLDYKRPTRSSEKVYIPSRDYPEVNFIGPRGHTLKKLEADSGAKISIRGKGSVKEGKAGVTPGEDEELHALVIADSEVKIKRAISAINKIIAEAASVPEGQNELKRLQLRELATLNGTLRDDDGLTCQNCGEVGHRTPDCPYSKNVTQNIVCKICGNAGHIAADCLEKDNPDAVKAAEDREQKYNNEYASLMASLGSNAPGGSGVSTGSTKLPWEIQSAPPVVQMPWQMPMGVQPPGMAYANAPPGMSYAPGAPAWIPPTPFSAPVFQPPAPPQFQSMDLYAPPPEEDAPPPPEEDE